mmetsp:Transcript_24206/g.52900  ORF Transcript_24206/g.52900 Transcript_24206/m.52900 type:complete len:231 (-) Transcript_24206:174-866(-)
MLGGVGVARGGCELLASNRHAFSFTLHSFFGCQLIREAVARGDVFKGLEQPLLVGGVGLELGSPQHGGQEAPSSFHARIPCSCDLLLLQAVWQVLQHVVVACVEGSVDELCFCVAIGWEHARNVWHGVSGDISENPIIGQAPGGDGRGFCGFKVLCIIHGGSLSPHLQVHLYKLVYDGRVFVRSWIGCAKLRAVSMFYQPQLLPCMEFRFIAGTLVQVDDQAIQAHMIDV